MEYTITIPENHPEKQELKKIIKALLDFLPLHSIYLSVDNNSFSPEIILTLIISDECEMDATDIRPFVSRLFKNYPQFKFTIFENRVAVEFWEEGSLYLMNHANGAKLAYTSDPTNQTFRLKKIKKAKKLLRNAEKEYLLLNAYADKSYIYSRWYSQVDNYLQAIFHLHQTLKYTFQKVELLIMGEHYPSQSLQEQQAYLHQFYPEFGDFFDKESEEESNLITMLDDSFRIIRYKNKCKEEFTKEILDLAITKKGQISIKAHEIFKECMARCKMNIKKLKVESAE
ncbi:hypothetical protein [Flavobacterium psychrotrophum]|uniref:hypothetical protein n=1 Tax=Flavobacterium psychrotrophum TaxID=2294119 RepID=UPI000E31B84F|nr:hypothetical protein [Flavobacterium psychrotrophum]